MSVQRMAKAAANDGAHHSGRARCIQSERAARPNMRATKQAVKAASVGEAHPKLSKWSFYFLTEGSASRRGHRVPAVTLGRHHKPFASAGPHVASVHSIWSECSTRCGAHEPQGGSSEA